MVKFEVEEQMLYCSYPKGASSTSDPLHESYMIVSYLDAYITFCSVYARCVALNMPLGPKEEFSLWKQLKNICEENKLELYFQEELPKIHDLLPKSYRQHDTTKAKRFRGFLAEVEREIIFDFKKEKTTPRKKVGQPAPYSKRHAQALIPKQSD